jgi:polar amino acid transport system permease protein
LVLSLFVGIFAFSFNAFNFNLNWAILLEYKTMIIDGFIATILISIASLVLSIIFGILLALASFSNILFLRTFAITYTELIRATPLLIQIIIFYFVIANAFGLDNKYIAGVLILSLFSSAYVGEIFRAGFKSIPKTQLESAMSVGFNKYQTFLYVIFPQLLSRSLPPLVGVLVNLVKDSSLLSIISIYEFTMAANQIQATTYSTIEIYTVIAVGYLIATLPISLYSKRLESKLGYNF